jgi:hypothetical protein
VLLACLLCGESRRAHIRSVRVWPFRWQYPSAVVVFFIAVAMSGNYTHDQCTSRYVIVKLLRVFESVLVWVVSGVRYDDGDDVGDAQIIMWCSKWVLVSGGYELTVIGYCVIQYPCKREPEWRLLPVRRPKNDGSLRDRGQCIFVYFRSSRPAVCSVLPRVRGCRPMLPCG